MDVNENYFDAVAPLYEGLNPIEHDIEFYCERATAVDGPVLEIGCGTGRVYLELLRRGVDAHGIDISRGMLEELERRAEAEGLHPAVERADMREFSLAVRDAAPFELVVIPLRTFHCNVTVEDQLATLEEIRSVLADDGRLVLNFPAPDFDVICEYYGEERRNTYEIDGQEYTVVDRNDLEDEIEQTVRTERRIYDADGEEVADVTQVTALISKREFELLLERVGFSSWEVYRGYGLEDLEPRSDHPQELVWVVEK